LQTTTMPDLVKGRQNLKIDVSERTGQLKALVKENFDRFISCKNTIDDIHKRLRKSEAHDSLSSSGNSTSDMVIAINEVFYAFLPSYPPPFPPTVFNIPPPPRVWPSSPLHICQCPSLHIFANLCCDVL